MGRKKVLTLDDEYDKYNISSVNDIPIFVFKLIQEEAMLNNDGKDYLINKMNEKLEKLCNEVEKLR